MISFASCELDREPDSASPREVNNPGNGLPSWGWKVIGRDGRNEPSAPDRWCIERSGKIRFKGVDGGWFDDQWRSDEAECWKGVPKFSPREGVDNGSKASEEVSFSVKNFGVEYIRISRGR